MVGRMLRVALTCLGALAGGKAYSAVLAAWPSTFPGHPDVRWQLAAAAVGGLIGLSGGPWLVKTIQTMLCEWVARLQRRPAHEIAAGTAGLIAGLVISGLLTIPIPRDLPVVGPYLPLALTLGLVYTSVSVSVKKWEDFSTLMARKASAAARENGANGLPEAEIRPYTILDTSVIIDGRVADIARTGFLDGTLVVPEFVLRELQHVADSPDMLRRNRGRRGLDILKQLQKEAWVRIEVTDHDFDDVQDVDTKLVRLAKLLGGKVMTNDYNLNKVAELHGVPVLNINELANALKPAVLPGEEMNVSVIRDGKEQGQGIAYLDDGTMIVVESGRRYIGTDVDVTVTSVLQTAAGRMIFARPNEPPPPVASEGRVKAAGGGGG